LPNAASTAEQSGHGTIQYAAMPPAIYPGPTGFYQPSVIPHPHSHHSHHHHPHVHSAPPAATTTHSQTYTYAGGNYPGSQGEVPCGVINGIAGLSFNSNNNSAPQSAPSTPLSLTHQKNPPLFPTPPIPLSQSESYDKQKNNGNVGGKRGSNGVPLIHQLPKSQNPRPQNQATQNQMVNGNNGKKSYEERKTYQKQEYQPKSYQQKSSPTEQNQGQNGQDKYRQQQQRIPPMNLDLKRNSTMPQSHHQNRSTPSTNSTESNNSPNSITSYDHNRNSGTSSYHGHNPGYHRSGSQGASSYHGSNVGPEPSTPTTIQTCFPFNIPHHQGAASGAASNPTHLLEHQALISAYNPGMTAYVKFAGQAAAFGFANVSSFCCF
jgi:hypothetical protein